VQGWRIHPGHFAERHSAVVTIALGESIVALGAGAAGVRLNAGEVVGVLLGMAIAGALWWASSMSSQSSPNHGHAGRILGLRC
jgi:low temperature requirement protein LtrA